MKTFVLLVSIFTLRDTRSFPSCVTALSDLGDRTSHCRVLFPTTSAYDFQQRVKREQPAVLVNGTFVIWPSTTSWDDSLVHLKEAAKLTVPIDVSTKSHLFTYADMNAPLKSVLSPPRYKLRERANFDQIWALLNRLEASEPYIRFGGNVEAWFPSLFDEEEPYIVRLSNDPGIRPKRTLFISSAGVTSTAHLDPHANYYATMWGEKNVLLAHPNDARHFSLYPSAHPRARQGQFHFENTDTLKSVECLEASLERGDLLYIPPGWIHHVRSGSKGVQIAMSATFEPDVHTKFNKWLTGPHVLPFLREIAGRWSFRRIVVALQIFFRDLRERLQSKYTINFDLILADLMHRAYSPDVRRGLGIVVPIESFPCFREDAPSLFDDRERKAIGDAALIVSSRFETMRPWQIRFYLLPFLETTLGRLSGKKRSMGVGLHFVRDCVYLLHESAGADREL